MTSTAVTADEEEAFEGKDDKKADEVEEEEGCWKTCFDSERTVRAKDEDGSAVEIGAAVAGTADCVTEVTPGNSVITPADVGGVGRECNLDPVDAPDLSNVESGVPLAANAPVPAPDSDGREDKKVDPAIKGAPSPAESRSL